MTTVMKKLFPGSMSMIVLNPLGMLDSTFDRRCLLRFVIAPPLRTGQADRFRIGRDDHHDQ